MAEVGTYYITVMPSMSGFTSAVNKSLGGLGTDAGNNFSTSFMDVLKGSALGTMLGNAASALGGQIMSGLSTGISRLDTISNYPVVMESLGYSAGDADKSIRLIMEHLDGLPTATQDMVTLTQAISDSTGDLDLATRAALGFNDMMLANGASSVEMANAQGVLNRVLGKGSATVAQWQSLMAVMPAQLGAVAREMLGDSASAEDLHAALEDGTVSWNDFLGAIVKLDEEGSASMASFEEQARANSKGIGTAIDNVKNRIGAGWASILGAIGREDISGTIDKVSYGIRDAMQRVAGGIEWLKWTIAGSSIDESLVRIWNNLKESLSGISVIDLKKFARGAIDLVEGALKWIADHGDVVTAALGGISGAIAVLIGYDISTKLLALPGILTGLWTVISANPFVALAVVVGTAVAALWNFFTKTEQGQAIVQNFCDTCTKLWDDLKKEFTEKFDAIKQNIETQKVVWANFKANLFNWNEEVRTNFLNKWQAIKTSVTDEVNRIKTQVPQNLNALRTNIVSWNEGVRQDFLSKWESIKSTVSSKVTGIKTSVTDTIGNIRTNIATWNENVRSDVEAKWQAINDAIAKPINAAKDAVSSAIERIKGILNTTLKFPHIETPHFFISGGEIPWGIGGKGTAPEVTVRWYGKGGIFDTATIIGIGEKGKEAALPLNRQTYGEIARGISREGAGGITINVNSMVVREEADIKRIANEVSRQVRRERWAMA